MLKKIVCSNTKKVMKKKEKVYAGHPLFSTHRCSILSGSKKGKTMEITNTFLFGLYGFILFGITLMAVYYADKTGSRNIDRQD